MSENVGKVAVDLAIYEDPGGGFWGNAVWLPSAISQGDTVDAVVDNLRSVVEDQIRIYRNDGVAVPWAEEASVAMPLIRRIYLEGNPS